MPSAYGTWKQRWINNDVYIFERQFFSDVVVVAINKSDIASYPISGLLTALPAGNYSDDLGGLQGGNGTHRHRGQRWQQPANDFTIAPHSVSVWQYQVNAAIVPRWARSARMSVSRE